MATAHAQEPKVLALKPPTALLETSDRQAATRETFGQVSILEVALAKKIDASDSTIDAVKQHAKVYDFYLVPLKFGVIGFDGKTCRTLQFGTVLRTAGTASDQAFILNVLPTSKLKEGSFKTNSKLAISGELEATTPDSLPASGSVKVGGSTELTWAWSPLFQQVAATYDQSQVMWTFDAVGNEFPIGQVEVGAIIAVAKSVPKAARNRLGFETELRASFGGGWFDRIGIASAKALILIRLPS
ncbi:hypothetical protein [Rhizobium leguminosarum]|uniref:hypothetical protein n=1 Tax=Rhizobium leguminosarum TaxID=384 RepID=UPI00102F4EF1|nr:hypothetical protein [Rhizobium leguminosarum]TAY98664.1 hypothetical protein ELH79_09405 [Rhizobium leguminosarum]TAZ09429.1 hypothetical protein ELH78_09405 [Rhizobium leguminosarum]